VPRQDAVVRLMDVADVVENHQPLIGDALANDGANLLLVIEKFPGSDTVKVTHGVENALAVLRPGLGGMEIDPTVFRPATFIEMAKKDLKRTLLIASVMAVLVIGLFFFNWRAALVSLISMPLSVIAAGLVLYWRGGTLNMMVAVGLMIAIGVIVDDAIAVVDGVMRRMRNPKAETSRSLLDIVSTTLSETRGTILFAAFICLLVVLPAFFMEETIGRFFLPLALTYVWAVLASTLVALFVTPALCAILLPKVSGSSPLLRKLQESYEMLLGRLLARPRAAAAMIVVLVAIGLGALPFLRPALLPSFQERDLTVRLKAAPGTSHPEMVRLVNRMTAELRGVAGVRSVVALVGRAVFGDQAVGINSTELGVNIDSSTDYGATIAAIDEVIHGYPGLDGEVQTYLNQISSQITEASAPVVVRLYGQEWAILQNKATELRQMLSGIAGVGDLKVALPVEEPTAEVEVDLAAAQSHGINPGNVRRAASTLLNGIQVGSLFQEQKIFDVVVWSTPKTRGSLAGIHDLLIDTPFDVPVRLGDVAKANIVPRPSLIKHENVSRYVDIGMEVTGRDVRAVVDEIRTRLRQISLPLEYHANVFGAFEQQHAARNRLLACTAIALIGILLLLQAAYDSWRLAFLSFLTLPLALAGGFAALAGAPGFSLAAFFGLITVFGIAARHQIALIRRFRQLEQDRSFSAELILHGAREQFGAIITTALIIELAFVPFVLVGDVPGLELLRPTALVIVSGVVTSVLVSLFVVPALYLRRVTRATGPQ
jgi:Cu/Ag efflux pump CusA